MKKILFASCLFAAFAFTACSDDDNDNNDGGEFIPPTAEEAIDAFNLKYDLEAALDVDTATFNYPSKDGYMFATRDRVCETGDTIPDFYGQFFVPADNEYVYKVLKFVEDEVFPIFGTEFIMSYMPRTIYFASEVQYHVYYSDKDYGLSSIAKDLYYTFEGGIACPEYLMFSHCCADFDTMDKNYLKRLYVSLVTEYIFNKIADSNLEVPTDFNNYSVKYTQGFDFWDDLFTMNENCSGYYESASEEFKTGWTNDKGWFDTIEEIVNDESLWHMTTSWFNCELRPGRVGACEVYNENEQTMERYEYPKEIGVAYFRPSMAQVMGDYVAFIVTTTAAEKETYFAEVQHAIDIAPEMGTPEAALTPAFQVDLIGLDGKIPTINDVIPDMKARIEACKAYFANYGITLADKN